MDMLIAPGEGYIPTYTRTDITDALHDAFGFRTDYQITSQKKYEKNFESNKKEVNINTYFPIKKTSQTAYLHRLRGFYLFSTVKDRIIYKLFTNVKHGSVANAVKL